MMDFRLNKKKIILGKIVKICQVNRRMVIIVHTLNMWSILSRRKSSYLSIPEK